jgi:DNA-binding NarL/FixJ family response regulator
MSLKISTCFIKQKWPHIRVVVLSMNASYRARALAAGADAFVSKADPPEQWLPIITGEQAG